MYGCLTNRYVAQMDGADKMRSIGTSFLDSILSS